MKTKKANDGSLELEALVRTHLKLDPAALARLGASRESGVAVEAGLHEFMRRVLERSLGFLWLPEDAVIRLRSAKPPGWPDAETFNLAQLLAWALVREPRRLRGLPQLPLLPADPAFVEDMRPPEARKEHPVLDLVKAASAIFGVDFDQIRDAPGPDGSQPVPVGPLIRSMLGVRPERLIRPYHDTEKGADEAFARDPEGQTVAGLSACLMKVLHNYPAVFGAQTSGRDCLAFQVADDEDACEGGQGVAEENMTALLMAGLFADGAKDVVFIRR